MKKTIDELVLILSHQLTMYRQLCTLLEEESEALVARRPEQVLEVTRRTEMLVLRLRTMDESRQFLCARMAKLIGVKAGGMTVSLLLRHPVGAQNKPLRKVRDSLRECMGNIQRLSAKNSRLCKSGLDLIARIMESAGAQTVVSRSSPYGPQSSHQMSTMSASVAPGRSLHVNTQG